MEPIEIEPMNCAVDGATYTIIDNWFGRDVSQKLLYEEDVGWLNYWKRSKFYLRKIFLGLRLLLRRPLFIFGGSRKRGGRRGKVALKAN